MFQRIAELSKYVGAGLVCWLALVAAVVIGTALGNGVPMARTASHAFREGVQQGLSNCPCAKKSAARVAAGPTPLKPTPEPVRLVPVPVQEDKQPPAAAGDAIELQKPEEVSNKEGR